MAQSTIWYTISKKSWPNLCINKLLYKMGQDFMDLKYLKQLQLIQIGVK